MIPSYDVALRLFRSGEFGVLARDFQNSQANDARVDPQVRILVAHALVWVGLPERARELLSNDIVAAMATGVAIC